MWQIRTRPGWLYAAVECGRVPVPSPSTRRAAERGWASSRPAPRHDCRRARLAPAVACSSDTRLPGRWLALQFADLDAERDGEPAILAEGEFDALLRWQEVGDLVGVATLGSCTRGLSARALRYLLGCPRLVVAYDVDAEGEKGAARLGQLSPRMQRIRPPTGKDVTAFWQAGGRVRDWVRFELVRAGRGATWPGA